MKTFSATPADIDKKWILIDAEGVVLGRLASIVAMRLRGKHKPSYTPHMDCGDNVIIINADKVQLTGKKRTGVWSPQGVIDMHRPELWGFLYFSETKAGQQTKPFVMPGDEYLKWALRNIYYRQRSFMANHKRLATLEEIKMKSIQLAEQRLMPEMLTIGHQYLARIQSPDTKKWWYIRNDGLVWKETIE